MFWAGSASFFSTSLLGSSSAAGAWAGVATSIASLLYCSGQCWSAHKCLTTATVPSNLSVPSAVTLSVDVSCTSKQQAAAAALGLLGVVEPVVRVDLRQA